MPVAKFLRIYVVPGAVYQSIAIGGGYAEPIADSVAAYANTFRVAHEVYAS